FGVAAIRKADGSVKRVFVLGYRTKDGQKRLTTVGRITLGLKKARETAETMLHRVGLGEDPVAVDKEQRRLKREKGLTVGKVGAEFIKRGSRIKKGHIGQPFRDKTKAEFKRLINVEIAPVLGRLEVAKLTTEHLEKLRDDVAKRGPVIAARVLGVLRL